MQVQDRILPTSDSPKLHNHRKPFSISSKNLDFSSWVSENLYKIVTILLLITTVAALFFLRNYSTAGGDAAALLCLQSTQAHAIHPKFPRINWNSIDRIADRSTPFANFRSEKWIVVSVSDHPSDSLRRMVKIKGWQVLAIGNSKTPKDWNLKGAIYLSLEIQAQLGFRVVDCLPDDSYLRKTVGYLFAIQHGAQKIYDVDDRGNVIDDDIGKHFDVELIGNLEPKEAESMIQHLEDVLFTGPNPVSQALFPSQYMTNRVVKLEKGIHYLYSAQGLNPSDKNSALVYYIQVHQNDFKLNVILQLFALIARQPAFHQLRSVEQLGYIVDLFRRNDSGVRGLYFLIQSNVKGPDQVDLRVESFLKMFETKLYEMPSDEFKSNVNAIIEMKLEKHKNLQEESEFYWNEISDGTFEFDGREHEAEALWQLTQKDLIDYFNKYIKVGAPLKKSLSVRVYGSAHSLQHKIENSQTAESS